MEIENWFNFVGDGLDQSNILVVFAMFDLVLGLSYHIKTKQGLNSSTMLAGIIHNFVPAFFPAVIYLMNTWSKTHSPVYTYASFVIFVCVGYFILQSILVNLKILGLELPEWLQNFLIGEIKDKRKDK